MTLYKLACFVSRILTFLWCAEIFLLIWNSSVKKYFVFKIFCEKKYFVFVFQIHLQKVFCICISNTFKACILYLYFKYFWNVFYPSLCVTWTWSSWLLWLLLLLHFWMNFTLCFLLVSAAVAVIHLKYISSLLEVLTSSFSCYWPF